METVTALTGTGVDEVLRPLAGREVLFCVNPGNAGDALLALGADKVFARNGIRSRWISPAAPGPFTGAIVVYGGGGNLTRYYREAADFLGRVHGQARRVVVLPHSVDGHTELLRSLGSNVTLFCREGASHAFVRRTAPGLDVRRSDDLALGLSPDDLRAIADWRPSRIEVFRATALKRDRLLRATRGVNPVAYWRNERFLRRVEEASVAGGRIARCFRADEEASAGELPEGNLDPSARFTYGIDDLLTCRIAAGQLIRFIRCHDRFETNRLHVCIPAAILGKPVRFFSNGYFKNRAMFEASLRDRFPNVEWVS